MFDEYIARHGRRLFGLCLKLCRAREDAEDLYQETWIKAYRFLDRYDEGKPFEGWLAAICLNAYRDMLRRHRWRARMIRYASGGEKDRALAAVAAPEEKDRREVREAVDALPEIYRVAVLLYYFHGMDVAGAARALRVPEGTVKYRLHRARELLKRRLGDRDE